MVTAQTAEGVSLMPHIDDNETLENPLPPRGFREFIFRSSRHAKGAWEFEVLVRSHHGTACIDRVTALDGEVSAAMMELLYSTLRDAIYREVVVTAGVQLTLLLD
jgi:hypothetical protein